MLSHLATYVPSRVNALDAATVEKIVKENLPKDIRLGASTLDLLLECCGGNAVYVKSVMHVAFWYSSKPWCKGALAAEFVQLVASEANTISEEEKKKTLNPEHVVSALERLGLSVFLEDVKAMWSELKDNEQNRSENIWHFCGSCMAQKSLGYWLPAASASLSPADVQHLPHCITTNACRRPAASQQCSKKGHHERRRAGVLLCPSCADQATVCAEIDIASCSMYLCATSIAYWALLSADCFAEEALCRSTGEHLHVCPARGCWGGQRSSSAGSLT